MRTIILEDIIELDCQPTPEEIYEYFSPDINPIEKQIVKTYHSKTIQKKAKVSAIQISHWTKTGIIIPATSVKGTGKMHIYDHQNLIEAMICRELSQYSINYGVMREVLDFLRERKWQFRISIGSGDKMRREKRYLTLWELLKQYPQDGMIHLLLWKDSPFIKMKEPKTGEYNMQLTALGIHEVVDRCSSLILLNTTILLKEVGSFHEEAKH